MQSWFDDMDLLLDVPIKANAATVFSSISFTKSLMARCISLYDTLPPAAVLSVSLCVSKPMSLKIRATALASFNVFLRRRLPS